MNKKICVIPIGAEHCGEVRESKAILQPQNLFLRSAIKPRKAILRFDVFTQNSQFQRTNATAQRES